MGINVLNRRPAVFLDRDGVINCNVLNRATQVWESPLEPSQVALIPGAAAALRELKHASLLLMVVSNQPNYAKAKASLETLEAIHARLLQLLSEAGASIDAFYYCLHHPEGVIAGYAGACRCRKPSPYFLLEARDAYAVDMERSWIVGDRATDIQCGHAAGVRTIRIVSAGEGNWSKTDEIQADYYAADLREAASIILKAQMQDETAL